MVVRYGAINDHDGEEDTEEQVVEDNISENSAISSNKYKTIFAGKINDKDDNNIERAWIILGALLSTISGVLFTANNFIINQYKVIVSDAVLVRCVIQIFIYSIIIFWNDDNLLPQNNKKKLFTISQGTMIITV